MAGDAAHVTMLQRSPDLHRLAARRATRWSRSCAGICRRRRGLQLARLEELAADDAELPAQPAAARAAQGDVCAAASSASCRPTTTSTRTSRLRYDPWDQRLCVVPDGDLFEAHPARPGLDRHRPDRDVHRARASAWSRARSSRRTSSSPPPGSNLQLLGGARARSSTARGRRSADTVAYKGMMFSGVPNLALSIGYTNASWTLKCDLICEYVCRLLAHMDERGYDFCVAAAARSRRATRAAPRLLLRLRAARDRRAAQAGPAAAVAAEPELVQGHRDLPPSAARGRGNRFHRAGAVDGRARPPQRLAA